MVNSTSYRYTMALCRSFTYSYAREWRGLAAGPSIDYKRMYGAATGSGSVLDGTLQLEGKELMDASTKMEEMVEELRAKLEIASKGGGHAAQERLKSRNKKPVRDRISAILDHGSNFLELSALAGEGLYEGATS